MIPPTEELATLPGTRAWQVSLLQPDAVVERMRHALSIGEQARAAAQRTAPARRRFIVRRATLRRLLALVTDTDAERLVFASGPDGKPTLAGPALAAGWQFNLSHAREIAVFVVARDCPVGIDVEWQGGSTPIESVARRYFSASEQARLDGVPREARRAEFFRIWVRKEAFLKGSGAGISEGIYTTRFGVPIPPEGLMVEHRGRWVVRDLEGLPPGYLGSVVLGGAGSAPAGDREQAGSTAPARRRGTARSGPSRMLDHAG